MLIIEGILVLILGLIFGSFLNVVVLRLPKGEKVTGRSKCASCAKGLGLKDLFPVASYLFLAGKCRYCKTRISPRYLVIEVLTGAVFLGLFLFLKPYSLVSWAMWAQAAAGFFVLLSVFITDFEHYLIFDEVLLYGGILVWLLNIVILNLTSNSGLKELIFYSILPVLVGLGTALPFYLIWHISRGEWIGFGDIKLFVFMGIFLSWPAVVPAVILASFIGSLVGLVSIVYFGKTLKSRLPFGCFLALGGGLGYFFGNNIWDWYMRIIGLY